MLIKIMFHNSHKIVERIFLDLSAKHLLKRDDLSAHLEVNKCLNISPLNEKQFSHFFLSII